MSENMEGGGLGCFYLCTHHKAGKQWTRTLTKTNNPIMHCRNGRIALALTLFLPKLLSLELSSTSRYLEPLRAPLTRLQCSPRVVCSGGNPPSPTLTFRIWWCRVVWGSANTNARKAFAASDWEQFPPEKQKKRNVTVWPWDENYRRCKMFLLQIKNCITCWSALKQKREGDVVTSDKNSNKSCPGLNNVSRVLAGRSHFGHMM